MSESIEWGEPPASRRGGIWKERLVPFIEKPGEWGRIPGDFSRDIVGQLQASARGGRAARYSIPPGRWQFSGRSMPDVASGHVALWVRYLGPAETTEVA